jgi:hypothetical protein
MGNTIDMAVLMRIKDIVDEDNKVTEKEFVTYAKEGLHIRLRNNGGYSLCGLPLGKIHIRERVSCFISDFREDPTKRDLLSHGVFCPLCQKAMIDGIVRASMQKKLVALRTPSRAPAPKKVKAKKIIKPKHRQPPKDYRNVR